MRKAPWIRGGLLGAIALVLAFTSPAQSQRPREALDDLPRELVKQTEIEEENVVKLLTALGPAIREQLAAGRTVPIPGLGTFRVVRIPEHRDLVTGRPGVIPAENYVEFVPDAALVRAANAPTAKPAVTVQPFEYIPLPGQTPGQRVPSGRQPAVRTR